MRDTKVDPRLTRPGAMKNNQATDDFPPSVGQTADHFAKRLLQECLAEQIRTYWERRAETFAAVGTPTCDEIAQACRHRAAMARFDDWDDAVAQLLREVC